MARKSTRFMQNPVRKVRLQQHKTLHEFGFECRVHWQVVFLTEAGVYPEINPSIKDRLVTHYDQDPFELKKDYAYFVKTSRDKFSNDYQPYILPEPDIRKSPIISLREEAFREPLAKMKFCKAICVQPALISRIEKAQTISLPGQLREALEDISFPVGWIEEIEYRNQEHYFFKRHRA